MTLESRAAETHQSPMTENLNPKENLDRKRRLWRINLMKKFSVSIALALFASAIALSPVQAQDDKQAEFERTWYAVCYTEKPINEDKCYQLSKELVEKYPNSTYIKNAKGKVEIYEKTRLYEKVNS